MRWFFGGFLFLILWPCPAQDQKYEASQQFQLAAPRVFVDSTFFSNSATVTLLFRFEGSQIRYTSNGEDVTKSSPLYSNAIEIKQSGSLRFKVFHKDYQPSATAEVHLKKLAHRIDKAEIGLDPEPNSEYEGNGSKSLVDGQKGMLQFRNGKNWLGFKSDTVSMALKFKQPLALSRISLSLLADQASWIFTPEMILVTLEEEVVGKWNMKDEISRTAKLTYIDIDIEKKTYERLSILIKPLEQIPDWHPGKGTTPWLFIDEILVE